MNIVKSSFHLTLTSLFSRLIGILGLIYFSNRLSPSLIGSYFLFESLTYILSAVSDLGINNAVEKRISEENSDSNQLYTAGLVLKSLPIIILALLIWFLRDLFNTFIGYEIILPLIVAILLKNISSYYTCVHRADLRISETGVIEFVQRLSWVIIGGITISIFNQGIFGLIYSLTFSFFVTGIIYVNRSNRKVKKCEKKDILSIIRYAKYNSVSNIGGIAYDWIDVLLLGYFLSPSIVGLYEIAWRISSSMTIFVQGISKASFPNISKLNSENRYLDIRENFSNLLVLSSILIIPASIGGIVLSSSILGVIFGEEYVAAKIILMILLIDVAIGSVQSIVKPHLLGIDKPKLAAYSDTISISLNILLNIILILEYGGEGAAIATLLATFANTILQIYYLHDDITIKIPGVEILYVCIVSVIMGAGVNYIQIRILDESAYGLIIAITSGVLIYLVLLSVNKALRRLILSEFKKIWTRGQTD